jgi:O-antigen ligase
VPWLGWRDWFGWAQMLAVFWVVLNGIRSSAPQRVLFFTIVLLGIVGVLLACYQVFVNREWQMLGGERGLYIRDRGSGSFGMPNSLAAFLVLVLPATAALSFRRSASDAGRVWWGWVTLVLLFGLVLTISRGAWLALGLAVTVWPLCVARGRWLSRIRIAALVLVGIALVGAVLYAKVPIVRARVTQLTLDAGERTRPIMWRAAWGLFREHPLVGTGAGSYDVLFEKYRPERFNDDPLYAHNDYLNTLSDYGLAGFLLFFGAAAIIAVRCARIRREEGLPRRDWLDSRTVLAALGIGLLGFALHLMVEFHFKIPALGLAVATVAGLVVSRAWPAAATKRDVRIGHRFGAGVVAVVCVVGFGLFFFPQFRAESIRSPARDAINALGRLPGDAMRPRSVIEQARANLSRASGIDPANGQVWADLAYATALWSDVDPAQIRELGRIAENAAEHALARSKASPEFWIRRGVARDLQGRWIEASDDFLRAVKLAPAQEWAWYYYAEHLSRVPGTREAADAAVAFCLRLDPSNQAGLALRQRLAIPSQAR